VARHVPQSLRLTVTHVGRPTSSDVGVAALVWALDSAMFGALQAGPFVVLVTLLPYAALAWRRTAPEAVFAVLWIEYLAGSLLVDGYRPMLGLLVALYAITVYRPASLSVPAMLATCLAMTPIASSQEVAQNPEDAAAPTAIFAALLQLLLIVLAWGLGRWVRFSKSRAEDLELRRERAAKEATLAERQRISRELHDIISHSVSVMVLQASGARRIVTTQPERADQALGQIEGVGRQAMSELKRLLGVLDWPPSPDADVDFGAGPQPGLGDLPELVQGVQLSGLTVRLQEDGRRRPLDPSVELSAYRIVQEALTNSIKHAGRNATATVHLTWAADNLLLEVTDDGGTMPNDEDEELSTLHGLPGLRERARAVGGRLEAGPEGDGFRVAAVLPLSTSGVPPVEEPVGDRP
jgi:signal transduction histidine kinase